MEIDKLRECVGYDPHTGEMWWKKPTGNRAKIGAKFGSNIDSKGYYRASFMGKQYRAHRIAWALYYGEMPDGVIDHINRNRLDNRICNLRNVGWKENAINISSQRNNTSGVRGVVRRSDGKKWVAQITVNYKNVYLGSFDTIDEAKKARVKAEERFFA